MRFLVLGAEEGARACGGPGGVPVAFGEALAETVDLLERGGVVDALACWGVADHGAVVIAVQGDVVEVEVASAQAEVVPDSGRETGRGRCVEGSGGWCRRGGEGGGGGLLLRPGGREFKGLPSLSSSREDGEEYR